MNQALAYNLTNHKIQSLEFDIFFDENELTRFTADVNFDNTLSTNIIFACRCRSRLFNRNASLDPKTATVIQGPDATVDKKYRQPS